MTDPFTTASRKGEYYHREITVANGAGPVWQEVTVSAGSQSQTKKLLFPPQTQNGGSANPLSYDPDGNLKSDGLWNYVWDAENRLIKMTSAPQVADAAKRELELRYDDLGRRIKKTVKTWTGSDYGNAVTIRYLYDGWRLVAELNGNTVLRSYLWGNDLSGSLDGAGGVGGLVAVTDHTTGAVYFPAYDGNGNVTALVKGTGQSVSARYEYGPLGELIRSTGPLAHNNPFRWSTKFTDRESDLVYYGYRYYSPSTGRWLSRDPVGEEGGLNLYALVGNNPINRLDPFGLDDDNDYELDLRLALAAEGSGFVATYAYDADLLAWHSGIMEEGWDSLQEGGKEIAFAVGMSVGPGVAGRLVGKGLGSVASSVAKYVSRGGHHPIAKFAGGNPFQILIPGLTKDATGKAIHKELHDLIRANLKAAGIPLDASNTSAKAWEAYFRANPGAQRRVFDVILNASKSMDAKHGTEITQSVWRNIMEERFESYP
ncbi:MAG: RHS repeat-associated core domain-containing protein [Candidatus Hydrogenedentes bacterium]|nr:RHS repeat-associated core domain-containing protein [Candidatus Hydrogenedentota bacterium]